MGLEAESYSYRWVILFSATIINFLTWGILYSVGVLFYTWVDYFDESKGVIAVAAALPGGIGSMLGPVYAFMIEKHGMRKMAALGGVIMATSHIFSGFANNVYYLCIVYGIFSGFGAGLANFASAFVLNEYFDKQRPLAEGIAIGGVSLGTFVFSFLQQFLIDNYGWKGTMLIIGGISLHIVIASMFLITPSYMKKFSSLKKLTKKYSKEDEIDITFQPPRIKSQAKGNFISRSIKIWKTPAFLVLLITDFFGWLAAYVPFVHLAERARLLGLDNYTAVWIVSTLGIAGIPGRPLIPACISFFKIHPYVGYGFVRVVTGLATIFSPLFSSIWGLFIYATIFGIFSCDYALHRSSTSRILGQQWFGLAASWILVFDGIAMALGPPFAGWIYDFTKSYDWSFYISGISFMISGNLAFVYCFKCLRNSTSRQNNVLSSV